MGELRSTSHTGNKRSCLLQVRKGFTSEGENSIRRVCRGAGRLTVRQSFSSVQVTRARAFSLLTSACVPAFLCVWVAGVPWASLRGCKQGPAWSTSTGCQRGVLTLSNPLCPFYWWRSSVEMNLEKWSCLLGSLESAGAVPGLLASSAHHRALAPSAELWGPRGTSFSHWRFGVLGSHIFQLKTKQNKTPQPATSYRKAEVEVLVPSRPRAPPGKADPGPSALPPSSRV